MVDAERAVTGQQSVPSGVLRMSVPTTYGHHRILPLLPAFRARYPPVRLDLHISNRNIDFVDEGYDLAIRATAPWWKCCNSMGCLRPFSVLYPHGRHLSLRARTFLDCLLEARDAQFRVAA